MKNLDAPIFRIVLVDDHSLFSHALKQLINSFAGYQVEHCFKNGNELLEALRLDKINPHLILLDCCMPGISGLETAKILCDVYPKNKFMVISMSNDLYKVNQMIEVGAKGYLLKDISPLKLLEALEGFKATGFYSNNILSQAMISRFNGSGRPQLNEKERMFLKLACSELTYEQIASEMCLSPKTIENYRRNLFEKLDVKNRVGMAMYAIKNDMINA